MTPLALLLAANACEVGADQERLGELHQNLPQGIIDTQSLFPYVVQIIIIDPDGQASTTEPTNRCTGTLVAPTYVVTAAHCLENYIAGCRKDGAAPATEAGFTYHQPDASGFATNSPMLRVLKPGETDYDTPATPGENPSAYDEYEVQAVRAHAFTEWAYGDPACCNG